MDDRELIETACGRLGFPIASWDEDHENGLTATLAGRWRVIEDDENEGLYADAEGVVTACVVGSAKHGNRRVSFDFLEDGFDGGVTLRSFDCVEQL